MIDAIRRGEDTFACCDEQTYRECTDEITLGELYPVASVWVTGESEDGSKPFENGIGKLHYTIPKEEFMEKREAFEEEVNKILAETVRTDYTDFEKVMALYAYLTSNWTYNDNLEEYRDEGFNYHCIMQKDGICCQIGGALTYLLLQCGVDALEADCSDETYHAWTYVMISGECYHVDATWGLHDDDWPLSLKYFMETDEERINDGFDLSELRPPLFMDSHGNVDESITFPATYETYEDLWQMEYVDMDRDRKVIICRNDMGEIVEFPYE